ncbi:MAG: lipoyl(octanoyl) transferase LipB [Bacteroidales bacterium]|nr:lipoyl(octanoyl) transferase LipB [Bacteroidales bacterium]
MSAKVIYIDLGLKEYKEAWDIQEMYHSKLLAGKDKNDSNAGTLIFCEHPHVYTLGKSGQQNNLLVNNDFLKKINATYYKSNRGGDITYHGPGQLVGYPIFDLEKLKLGVKDYIHLLEHSIIDTLKEYNISATRLEKATGVWLDAGTEKARKICAIGVRVSKAVTMHGFALNINTDLKYFSYINPCGFIDKSVTSIQKELSKEISTQEVKTILKKRIEHIFSLSIQ